MLQLHEGTEVLGRYVIYGVIGVGGSGAVWRAYDKQLGRNVALKRLFKPVGGEDPRLALEEAKKSAQLVNPNIVQIHDILACDGEHLIVMEYVDGPSLWDALRDKGKRGEIYPIDVAVSLLKNILEGVAYAHSKDICHRDLSPLNILLTSTKVPKISDFGLARVLRGAKTPERNETTEPQGGTGNPLFMSPEQARGEPADFSSDLFMVGIIGYLLLSGRHPYGHASGLFTVNELLRDTEFSPEPLKPAANLSLGDQRLYREYAAITLRLLNRERAGRYASAREAIAALEAVTPEIECQKCGRKIADHSRFCSNCGSKVDTVPEDEAPVTELVAAGPAALTDFGFRLTRGQRWQEAIQLFRLAIEQDPMFQKAYWTLGFALNHERRYEEATAVLTKGLELGTDNPEYAAHLYAARSYALENLKSYIPAMDDISKALAADPQSPNLRYRRARIYSYLGDVQSARDDAKEVLRLLPEHGGAIRLLEDLPGD